MAIVIKKRVSLGFLGDDYKEAYLNFKSVPLADYSKIIDEITEIEDKKDNKKYLNKIMEYLKKYFLDGEFPEEGKLAPVTHEDLEGLDPETSIICFQTMTGQIPDPKGLTTSQTPLPTEDSTSMSPSTNTKENLASPTES